MSPYFPLYSTYPTPPPLIFVGNYPWYHCNPSYISSFSSFPFPLVFISFMYNILAYSYSLIPLLCYTFIVTSFLLSHYYCVPLKFTLPLCTCELPGIYEYSGIVPIVFSFYPFLDIIFTVFLMLFIHN